MDLLPPTPTPVTPQPSLMITIITGLSGAGMTKASRFFEDAGHFLIDNLPPTLLTKFAQLCYDTHGKITKVAIVIDIRGGKFFESMNESLQQLENMGVKVRILFLEAEDGILVRRFSETRRKHPLSSGGRIVDDIKYERKRLAEIRSRADFIINTSDLSSHELYEEIRKIIEHESATQSMSLVIVSFGFKHGIPLDADMVFDVRFLPNPYYVPEMKFLSGLDKPVADFVLGSEVGTQFAGRLKEFLEYLVPQFVQEPKTRVQIAIGCTGGRHRSVALAEYLADTLKHPQVLVSRRHRDLELD